MSRSVSPKIENHEFVVRLIEVCGTAQSSELARMLNISYQAAKNYLSGRIPDAKILRRIADRTPYSLHWLLTGTGDKFVAAKPANKDTHLLTDAIRALIEEQCRAIVGEFFQQQLQTKEQSAGEKIVVLSPHQIRDEKIIENAESISSEK